MHIESDEFQSHYHLPEIKDLYLKQWAKGYHPVFSAAAIMNPAYHHKFGYTELWGDAGVQKDLHKMMGRFFNTVNEKQAAVAQLSQYKHTSHPMCTLWQPAGLEAAAHGAQEHEQADQVRRRRHQGLSSSS